MSALRMRGVHVAAVLRWLRLVHRMGSVMGNSARDESSVAAYEAEADHDECHHPMLCATGRHGCWCWCWCSCGWRSDIYTTVSGAHIEFGGHLLVVARRDVVNA